MATATNPPTESPLLSHPQLPPARQLQRWWMAAVHAFPNLVVFSLLGGIMVFGHHSGWKLPRMSELTRAGAVTADDWCEDHLVPESQCIECRDDLLPKRELFGFCREHGVAECVHHHPELAQLKGDLPLPKYDTAQAIAMVDRPHNNSRNTLHTHRIQFTSAESVAKAGIEVDVVQEQPLADAITANGELQFDPTRVAHLTTRVPGTVLLVFKSLGDEVQAGEVLALVDAAQVGQVKAQLLQAIVQLQLRTTTVDRLRSISTSGAIAHKSVIEAEAVLQEAEIAVITARQALANLGFELPETLDTKDPNKVSEQLRFLGIPKSLVSSLPSGTKTANLIPIQAPYGGTVVDSEVVAGEVVNATSTLFTVADPTRLWLQLHVRQEDAKYVRRGLPVKFRTDDDQQEVAGSVAWVSPALDEQTRTVRLRVAVANADGRLRDKVYGTGRIILREEPHAIVVPRVAVQSTPDAHFVFVRDKNYFDQNGPKFFHVRQVRIGASSEQFIELLAGVLPGEVVATKGSTVLLAQLLRGNLGAGCGCHDH